MLVRTMMSRDARQAPGIVMIRFHDVQVVAQAGKALASKSITISAGLTSRTAA
jgi:hypothetical protein